MILFPAIDLRNGNCVRLYQGDYNRETVYGTDPVAQARRFVAEGAEAIHVVDLDAALTGEPTNRPVIAAICDAVSVPVQVGGGVRSTVAAEELFAAGVHRVVIGTAALENPSLVIELAGRGRRIAVGLDAHGDEVATHGWTERTGRTVGEVAQQFADCGVEALVVTEISRDGTLTGPDVDGLTRLLAATVVPVVASGGVGGLDDLTTLSSIAVDNGADRRRFAGVIVGRALYEGAFTLPQALAAVAGVESSATAADREDGKG